MSLSQLDSSFISQYAGVLLYSYGANLETNPINNININAYKIQESDIDSLVDGLMDHFSPRIHTLSTYVYGAGQGVALSAFKEYAADTINKGLHTFIFKSQHWRSGRSIGPYLLTCLSKLADSLKSDIDFVKKISIPICPACKMFGDREYLIYEGKMLRCQSCTRESARLESLSVRSSYDEFVYRLRRIFSLHSRKGHHCPKCERFIPDSYLKNGESIRISCPYDNCDWFGITSELEPMAHPLGLSSGSTVSLNATMGSSQHGGQAMEFQDRLDAQDVNPDIKIEQTEKYHRELGIAKSVIAAQKARFAKLPMSKVIKKYSMYQAFELLLEQDPAGMIGYLIHGKSIGERPIQSLIFQTYIELIENKLPFKLFDEEGKLVEVFSLLDSGLNLFLGTSEYGTYVRESGLVSNNTHEIFVGAKCNGPCFIGFLCDITDDNGKSLLKEVEYYTFSNIKMKSTVPQNTPVHVVHFRIPPHYEMYSLVNLQRTRKCIVTSIHKRLGIKSI
jgi:hypothetical protein